MTTTTKTTNEAQYTVTLTRLFNGQETGRQTTHRVRNAEGLRRVLVRACGRGHGAHVTAPRALVAYCGGYLAASGELLIPVPGCDPVAVSLAES